jgi:hypothetical protein
MISAQPRRSRQATEFRQSKSQHGRSHPIRAWVDPASMQNRLGDPDIHTSSNCASLNQVTSLRAKVNVASPSTPKRGAADWLRRFRIVGWRLSAWHGLGHELLSIYVAIGYY